MLPTDPFFPLCYANQTLSFWVVISEKACEFGRLVENVYKLLRPQNLSLAGLCVISANVMQNI